MGTRNKGAGWLVAVLVGLLVVGGAGAAAVYYLLNRLDLRAELERLSQDTIGRPLSVAGEVRVSFWPTLGFEAESVSLANVIGGRAPALVAADRIHIGVELLPLLGRKLVVRRLVFDRPRIALEIDAEGRPNWLLTLPQAGADRTLALHDARFNDGELSFFDAARSVSWTATDVDLRTALRSLDQPVQVEGSLALAGRQLDLRVEIDSPRALAAAMPTQVRGALNNELVQIEFNGAALPSAGRFDGQLSAGGESLRQLAAWGGVSLAGAAGFERFAVEGRFEVDGPHYSFNHARFVVDRIEGRGYISLTARHAKPFLSSRVRIGELDLNPYLTADASQGEPARALDVRAGAATQPIDLSGLAALNGEFEIAADRVILHLVRAEQVSLSAQLRDSLLTVSLQQMTLYGGRARGELVLDGRGSRPRFTQRLDVENVDLRPLLSAAVNFASIEGRADLALDLTAEGTSARDMVRTADGRIQVDVGRGTLHGVDLGGVSRTISNAMRGELVAAGAATPFNGMSGAFVVADGVLASDDISFETPELSIPAVALVDLNTQQLVARLSPRSPRGGLAVPFTVEGALGALRYNSDLRGLRREEIQGLVAAVGDAQVGGPAAVELASSR